MSKHLRPIGLGLFAMLLAVLALAWYDGGREDLREITRPLALPELNQ